MSKTSVSVLGVLAVVSTLVPGICQGQAPPPPPPPSGRPAPPQITYPMKCSGATGMAEIRGREVIINFRKGDRPADQGVQHGQCTWMDRGLRDYEPAQILSLYPNVEEARKVAEIMNTGGALVFQVFNEGKIFRATGTRPDKPTRPQRID